MSLLTTLKCRTKDCPNIFPSRSNGNKFCGDCARKRKIEQNRRSNIAYAAKSDTELELIDMPAATVDRIFSQALAQIRRDKVHRLEDASFDYRNRYREP